MFVSVSEFRANMMRYLEMASTEDVVITRHDEIIATVSNTGKFARETAESLRGILSGTVEVVQ